jgi:hypothetical protein
MHLLPFISLDSQEFTLFKRAASKKSFLICCPKKMPFQKYPCLNHHPFHKITLSYHMKLAYIFTGKKYNHFEELCHIETVEHTVVCGSF